MSVAVKCSAPLDGAVSARLWRAHGAPIMAVCRSLQRPPPCSGVPVTHHLPPLSGRLPAARRRQHPARLETRHQTVSHHSASTVTTRPVSTVTLPASTVTQPASTVTRPASRVTQPASTVTTRPVQSPYRPVCTLYSHPTGQYSHPAGQYSHPTGQ